MATSKNMQIHYDLCSLFREQKLCDVQEVRKSCVMKVASVLSKTKPWNHFRQGKKGRDLSSELLIPKHVTALWQSESGELRALK